jgi:hypothetical protein
MLMYYTYFLYLVVVRTSYPSLLPFGNWVVLLNIWCRHGSCRGGVWSTGGIRAAKYGGILDGLATILGVAGTSCCSQYSPCMNISWPFSPSISSRSSVWSNNCGCHGKVNPIIAFRICYDAIFLLSLMLGWFALYVSAGLPLWVTAGLGAC